MKAEILILGVLHREPMHPYEIKRRLKAAQVENYIDVDVGTLYYAVKQLAKDGLIEERGQEKSGKQVRTIYGVTDKGRARLQQLIQEGLSTIGAPHPIYPALLFLHLADRDKAKALMAERIEKLTQGHGILSAILNHIREATTGGMRLLMEHALAHALVEIDWSRKVLEELEAGAVFAGDPGKFTESDFTEKLENIATVTECRT